VVAGVDQDFSLPQEWIQDRMPASRHSRVIALMVGNDMIRHNSGDDIVIEPLPPV
jgi:hypothetical protein